MMPVLNPAGVQDILDMGLLGWAMSRYTGRWVGFKTIAETVESSASVDVDPFALRDRAAGDAISRCRRAASTSAGRIRRWTRKCACTVTR